MSWLSQGSGRKASESTMCLVTSTRPTHAGLTKWLSEADEHRFIKGGIMLQLGKGFFTNFLKRGALLSKEVLYFIFMNFFPLSSYVSFECMSLTESMLQHIDEAMYLM